MIRKAYSALELRLAWIIPISFHNVWSSPVWNIDIGPSIVPRYLQPDLSDAIRRQTFSTHDNLDLIDRACQASDNQLIKEAKIKAKTMQSLRACRPHDVIVTRDLNLIQ